MRFFDVFMFVLMFNVSVAVVNAFGVFGPQIQADMQFINVVNSTAANAYNTVSPGPSSLTNFGAFVWNIMTAAQLFVNILIGATVGFAPMLTKLFQCGVIDCSAGSGVGTFILMMSSIVYIIYGIGIVNVLRGTGSVESNG